MISSQFGLRLLGFDIFPNTVSAKQSDFEIVPRIWGGLYYYYFTLREAPASGLVAFASIIWITIQAFKKHDRQAEQFLAQLSFAVITAFFAFAFASGGDWMEAGRFLVVPIALSIFFGAMFVSGRAGFRLSLLLPLLFLLEAANFSRVSFGGIPLTQRYEYSVKNYEPSSFEFRNVIHARDIGFIDRMISVMKTESSEDDEVVIASIQAGMVPYYLFQEFDGRLQFVDLYGLSTNHVHDCRGNNGWGYDPNKDIVALQKCAGITFDYIHDPDNHDWPRLESLLKIGCVEIFREELTISHGAFWKPEGVSRQFLARCPGNQSN